MNYLFLKVIVLLAQLNKYLVIKNKKAANQLHNNQLTAFFFFLVPEAGLEPARTNVHKILSLACLPIPPLGHQPLTRSGDHKVSEETVVWRAKDEIRTRDPDLGKVVLYQLSYFRL